MKLAHNDTRILVIAFVGSLIFHTFIIFAIDFRFETRDQEPRVLNVQLVAQSTSTGSVTGTPLQDQDIAADILDSVVSNSKPHPVTDHESSHQENRVAQPKRNTKLSSDRSTDTTEPKMQVTETPPAVVNVLEPNPTSNELPKISMQDLLKTATAIVREQSSEQTVRNITGDETTNIEEEYYLKAWLKKVQKIGQLNYPQEAVEKKLYGKLRLYVSIKPDGTVKETRVVRSSGHEVLDEAAKRIVDLASPFSAFPPSMRENLDLLEIVREWEFRKEALVPSTDTDED
ncbi:MAG: energy transducer TonB [Gammaproteobacteria bacterium]|nr:energy transducer TonB [Gammaproteobacteria bacterium]MYC24337.1 energy transducer TonB [Gammaproteobacteria bacterium]